MLQNASIMHLTIYFDPMGFWDGLEDPHGAAYAAVELTAPDDIPRDAAMLLHAVTA